MASSLPRLLSWAQNNTLALIQQPGRYLYQTAAGRWRVSPLTTGPDRMTPSFVPPACAVALIGYGLLQPTGPNEERRFEISDRGLEAYRTGWIT